MGTESMIQCPSIPERKSWGQSPQIHCNMRAPVYYCIHPHLTVRKIEHAQFIYRLKKHLIACKYTFLVVQQGFFDAKRGRHAEDAPHGMKHKGAHTLHGVKRLFKDQDSH